MASIFLNCTRHPSRGWSDAQMRAAEALGDVVDVDFPDVPPEMGEEHVAIVSKTLYILLKELAEPYDLAVVHLMGETSVVVTVMHLHTLDTTHPPDPKAQKLRFVVSASRHDPMIQNRQVRFRYHWVRFRNVPSRNQFKD
jgi:hypothetical protein